MRTELQRSGDVSSIFSFFWKYVYIASESRYCELLAILEVERNAVSLFTFLSLEKEKLVLLV